MANYRAFLRVDRIRGEVTTPPHVGDIELISYSFGGAQGESIKTSTAGDWVIVDGKSMGDMTVLKYLDKTSGEFFNSTASGRMHESVILMVERPSGNGVIPIFTLLMQSVTVTGVYPGGSEGDRLIESITFGAQTFYIKKGKK